MHPFSAANYLDLSDTPHAELFSARRGTSLVRTCEDRPYLKTHLRPGIHGDVSDQAFVGSPIFIGAGSVVEPGATIKGPAWIGRRLHDP